ncbi:MAG: rane-bound metal-dependent hydrolase [Actinoallomurus sp.]|jgi:membrane-bound metal-dependent hydrolase YbcI (DUF457 family)|nr:rane-bound metal-dependent hydrolase [Actinoallomurus sp.]
MMGHTHALAGATAWLGTVPLLADHGMRMTPGQVVAGSVVCAGAGLLPDLDHHDGTIANAFGPVTRILCRGVAAVSGGHRHATHSLVFCVLALLGADWLAKHAVHAWWVMLFLLLGLGLRGIGIRVPEREHFNVLLNGAIAAGLTYVMAGMHFAGPGIDLHGYVLGWAGLAVGLGSFVHVLTDCLTPEGCPVLWPIQTRFEIPVVPRTDGVMEKWVVTPILSLGMVVLAVRSAAGSFATHWLQHNRG